jgi:hypothetical protein
VIAVGEDEREIEADEPQDQVQVVADGKREDQVVDQGEREIVADGPQDQVQVVADDELVTMVNREERPVVEEEEEEEDAASYDHAVFVIDKDDTPEDQAVDKDDEGKIIIAEPQDQVQVVANDEQVTVAGQKERSENVSAARLAAVVEEKEMNDKRKVEILDRAAEQDENAEPIADVEDGAAPADEPEQTEVDEDQEQKHYIIIEEEEEAPQSGN